MTSRFPWQENYGNGCPYQVSTRYQSVRVPEREMIDEVVYIQCDLSSVPWECSAAGRPRLGVRAGLVRTQPRLAATWSRGLVHHTWELPELYVTPVAWGLETAVLLLPAEDTLRVVPGRVSRRFSSSSAWPSPLGCQMLPLRPFTQRLALSKSRVQFCWQMVRGGVRGRVAERCP